MSTLTTPTTSTTAAHRVTVLHPLVAAIAGAATFALAMAAGELFDLNSDDLGAPATTWSEIAVYAGLVLTAVLIAVWLGVRARAGTPRRLAGTALGLAIAAAVLFVVFWSGWPHVFAAVAAVLALEHRRRVGSFSATAVTALVISAIVLIAATGTCLVG